MKSIKFTIRTIMWSMLLYFLSFDDVNAKSAVVSQAVRTEKILPCDDTKTQKVRVALGRLTILSFPVKPKDILPGENGFDFRQIKNDLAIKVLRLNAKTNDFFYLL